MESVEKLREWISEGHGTKLIHDGALCLVQSTVRGYLDEIEREIEEKYMLLPVDAEGLPIRVGDNIITNSDNEFTVSSIADEYVHAGGIDLLAHAIHHVKPDPVKELLEEFALVVDPGSYVSEKDVDEYAKKLREAVSAE